MISLKAWRSKNGNKLFTGAPKLCVSSWLPTEDQEIKKNSLLQSRSLLRACVLGQFRCGQLCAPLHSNRHAPQSMEASRQEYWSGLPCPSPGDLPGPGVEPIFPALPMDSFPTGKPEELTVGKCYYHVWKTYSFLFNKSFWNAMCFFINLLALAWKKEHIVNKGSLVGYSSRDRRVGHDWAHK